MKYAFSRKRTFVRSHGLGLHRSIPLRLAWGVTSLILGCSSSNDGGVNPAGSVGGSTGIGGAASTTSTGGQKSFESGGAGTGGASQTGGRLNTGGERATGGSYPTSTPATSGGSGAITGGAPAMGGYSGNGDTSTGGTSTGGAHLTGGSTSTGGANSTGGIGDIGGSKAVGGSSSIGGTASVNTGGSLVGGSSGTGPCDIYAAVNTPCVAAHSTVRALYGAYSGNLYQVRRASDKTTKDIAVQSPGGYASASVQDSFCTGTTCTISVIYDQSPKANHLTKAPAGGWLNNGGLEANATAAKIMLNGHTVYGVYTTGNFDNDVGAVGYRNNKTQGVPTGDQAESMYMVVSGKHYNQWCCFDYGNAETNNKDNGPATMEAVYFGTSTQWGRGSGTGPWVMADLEDGVFAGGSFAAPASNTTITADFVTALLKGYSGNRFALKAGNAQSGALAMKYDGTRPNGYSPQKKEGAIILGIGGDNSHTGEGTFFEGVMTAGVPPDTADDAVQANIVSAGYGK